MSFETILDYVHQRVVLIRLDSTGHRLAAVPAYHLQRYCHLCLHRIGDTGGWRYISVWWWIRCT